jgi:formiminotetrahydrofolate cyclodeaminase
VRSHPVDNGVDVTEGKGAPGGLPAGQGIIHGVDRQTIGTWLTELASDAPAPGGGAAAAMHAAVGAALIGMVCNLTIGKPRYAVHERTMAEARDRSAVLRREAVALAEADAVAFAAVTDAYRLPHDTDELRTARTAAVQHALVGATEVPLRTAEVAADLIGLAGQVVQGANTAVLSDVAVAAASARAALDSATVNVEINLACLADHARREEFAARLAPPRTALPEADRIVAAIRARIAAR